MTENPEEPVTLRQIFSAVQGLRADVQALNVTVQQFKEALKNQGDEITRIRQRQFEVTDDHGERLRALERREHGRGAPNGA